MDPLKRSQTSSSELQLDGFLNHLDVHGTGPRTARLLPAQADEISWFLSLGNLTSCSMLSASPPLLHLLLILLAIPFHVMSLIFTTEGKGLEGRKRPTSKIWYPKNKTSVVSPRCAPSVHCPVWVLVASSAAEALPPLPIQDLFITSLSFWVTGHSHRHDFQKNILIMLSGCHRASDPRVTEAVQSLLCCT